VRHGDRDELMASTAAYSGLRWGELAALTISQIDPAARVIAVDRKVVEVAGHLYVEAPKNRKYRRTIYPRRTPAGYPLADRLEQARAEQAAATNPLGLIFPVGCQKSAWPVSCSDGPGPAVRHLQLVPAECEGHYNGRRPHRPAARSARPGPTTLPPTSPRSRSSVGSSSAALSTNTSEPHKS
jgi:hypothetical protein